jgi:colanic acid/amylovoran biosynthesis protein
MSGLFDGMIKITEPRACITVGLLWHSFTSDNLGVGALSVSQIDICEEAARKAKVNLCFIVFGTSGNHNYTPLGRNIRRGSQFSLKQLIIGRSPFLQELDECDLVLDIGEGDSFTDIYGLRRFRMHVASKLAVLIKHKLLILCPQTIGPFNYWYSRWVARKIMLRAGHIFARDGLSAEYMNAVGLVENVSEATDVAFRLPFVQEIRQPGEVQRVGINVSGLLFSGGYTRDNQFGLSLDYPKLVRNLLTKWCADRSIEVWLIPHVLSDEVPQDDDRIIIDKLIEEFPGVHVAHNFQSPSEAKSFISGLDFMTGARMHACIAALSSGVPVVPFAYSRKFNGLFESLDYHWLADGKEMSIDQAFNAITKGYENRNELRIATQNALKKAEIKLAGYESYLAEAFTICHSKKIGAGYSSCHL